MGFNGEYINPTGGERAGSRKVFEIPTRFDTEPSMDQSFAEQNDIMFLTAPSVARLVAKYSDNPEEASSVIERKFRQIFVRNLAYRDRLRIKFPQHPSPVVLDFPLQGARDALLEVVKGCSGVPVGEGTKAFLDEEGNQYATLEDFLMDETWLDRFADRSKSP